MVKEETASGSVTLKSRAGPGEIQHANKSLAWLKNHINTSGEQTTPSQQLIECLKPKKSIPQIPEKHRNRFEKAQTTLTRITMAMNTKSKAPPEPPPPKLSRQNHRNEPPEAEQMVD